MAEKLGHKWINSDISDIACTITNKRLQKEINNTACLNEVEQNIPKLKNLATARINNNKDICNVSADIGVCKKWSV